MKKAKILLSIFAVALLGFFTSCEKEDPNPPTLTLDGTGTNVSTDKDLENGEAFTVKIVAVKGDANLASFKAERIKSNVPVTIVDSTLTNASKDNYQITLNLTADIAAGEERFVFTITDKDGEKAEKSFIITTEEPASAGTISTHTISLGAQDNAQGSFFASLSGDVYTISELKAGSHYNKIDLVYYFGATNKEAIFSPNQIVASSITWGGALVVSSWGTANETKFKKVEASDYANATFESLATLGSDASLNLANGGLSTPDGLKVGHVYAFKTAANKYGVFEVTNVGTGATGSISIKVKIQD